MTSRTIYLRVQVADLEQLEETFASGGAAKFSVSVTPEQFQAWLAETDRIESLGAREAELMATMREAHDWFTKLKRRDEHQRAVLGVLRAANAELEKKTEHLAAGAPPPVTVNLTVPTDAIKVMATAIVPPQPPTPMREIISIERDTNGQIARAIKQSRPASDPAPA